MTNQQSRDIQCSYNSMSCAPNARSGYRTALVAPISSVSEREPSKLHIRFASLRYQSVALVQVWS